MVGLRQQLIWLVDARGLTEKEFKQGWGCVGWVAYCFLFLNFQPIRDFASNLVRGKAILPTKISSFNN